MFLPWWSFLKKIFFFFFKEELIEHLAYNLGSVAWYQLLKASLSTELVGFSILGFRADGNGSWPVLLKLADHWLRLGFERKSRMFSFCWVFFSFVYFFFCFHMTSFFYFPLTFRVFKSMSIFTIENRFWLLAQSPLWFLPK